MVRCARIKATIAAAMTAADGLAIAIAASSISGIRSIALRVQRKFGDKPYARIAVHVAPQPKASTRNVMMAATASVRSRRSSSTTSTPNAARSARPNAAAKISRMFSATRKRGRVPSKSAKGAISLPINNPKTTKLRPIHFSRRRERQSPRAAKGRTRLPQ